VYKCEFMDEGLVWCQDFFFFFFKNQSQQYGTNSSAESASDGITMGSRKPGRSDSASTSEARRRRCGDSCTDRRRAIPAGGDESADPRRGGASTEPWGCFVFIFVVSFFLLFFFLFSPHHHSASIRKYTRNLADAPERARTGAHVFGNMARGERKRGRVERPARGGPLGLGLGLCLKAGAGRRA
jgi:hypothetical protein